MTDDLGHHTYNEIMSQPETWRLTLKAVQAQADDIRAWGSQPHHSALFVGCGSTYFLSLSASRVWQVLTQTPAAAWPSSEAWLFSEQVFPNGPFLLLAHSRSGETSETLNALRSYRDCSDLRSLVITCRPDNALAKTDSLVVASEWADEESVAQTRAFTSMLLASQAAAALVADREDHIAGLTTLPDQLETLLPQFEPLAQAISQDDSLDHFVFLGSGVNHGLANEAMLKMKEMSQTTSEAFHFLEYRHGPKATMGPTTLITGLVSDEGREQELQLLSEAQASGARTLAIGDPLSKGAADLAIRLPESVSGLTRGLLALPLLQLMAYFRATRRGLDPDRPAQLDRAVLL
jgi:glucosamine--fructose-6-phosphate aminotransferase (isomerizing)